MQNDFIKEGGIFLKYAKNHQHCGMQFVKKKNVNRDTIGLIASKILFQMLLGEAQGSSFKLSKYAEGYPGRRYYGGVSIYWSR